MNTLSKILWLQNLFTLHTAALGQNKWLGNWAHGLFLACPNDCTSWYASVPSSRNSQCKGPRVTTVWSNYCVHVGKYPTFLNNMSSPIHTCQNTIEFDICLTASE